MAKNTITLEGNLTADPTTRFTPAGAAVTRFRVASTERKFNRQANSWEDGDTLFIDVEVWREEAEAAAESLHKGTSVLVTGRLRMRTYTPTGGGDPRTVFEVVDATVAVKLGRQTAVVSRSAAPAQQSTPAAPAPAPAAPAAAPAARPVMASTGPFDEPPF